MSRNPIFIVLVLTSFAPLTAYAENEFGAPVAMKITRTKLVPKAVVDEELPNGDDDYRKEALAQKERERAAKKMAIASRAKVTKPAKAKVDAEAVYAKKLEDEKAAFEAKLAAVTKSAEEAVAAAKAENKEPRVTVVTVAAAKEVAPPAPVEIAAPVMAAEPVAAEPVVVEYRYISLDAAKRGDIFKNFDLVVEGQTRAGRDQTVFGPSGKIRIFGQVFKDCDRYFTIEQHATKGAAGFMIKDEEGRGQACMKSHAGQSCSNIETRPNYCVSLSGRLESTLDLASAGDVETGLFSIDSNKDVAQQLQFKSFELRHHSAASINSMIAERKKQERADKIAGLTDTVSSCRANSDELNIARGALAQLVELRAVDEPTYKKVAKELERAEISMLGRRAQSAPLEELSEIEEIALERAGNDCENAEGYVAVLRTIALRYSKAKDAGAEGFDQASMTIGRAQEISCLKDTTQAILNSYQRDIAVGRCSKIAEKGMTNNFLLQPCVTQLATGLQSEAFNACQGDGASLEACGQSMAALRSVVQLPERAKQVEQKRQELMQQIQQAMNGGNSGTTPPMLGGGQSQMNPGFMPTAGGSSFYGGGQFGMN